MHPPTENDGPSWPVAPRAQAEMRRLLAISLSLFAPAMQADGRTTDVPLVEQVAGNCYERRVWEPGGDLDTLQRIFVHDWTEDADGPHARIEVVSFKQADNGGEGMQVEKRIEFRIVGDITDDAQEEAALQIIGHLGDKRRIALDFFGDTRIVPVGRCKQANLSPVEFNVKVKGGLADLLGGRGEIRIVNRDCSLLDPVESGERHYLIEGELQMKMYLVGIRFKKRRYEVRQVVDPQRGLVRYVLTDDDGTRQEIELVEDSACSAPWARNGS